MKFINGMIVLLTSIAIVLTGALISIGNDSLLLYGLLALYMIVLSINGYELFKEYI